MAVTLTAQSAPDDLTKDVLLMLLARVNGDLEAANELCRAYSVSASYGGNAAAIAGKWQAAMIAVMLRLVNQLAQMYGLTPAEYLAGWLQQLDGDDR